MKFDNFIVLESSKALLNIDKENKFCLFSFIFHPVAHLHMQTANGVGVEQIGHCLCTLYRTL